MAPDLDIVLTHDAADNDGPASVASLPYLVTDDELKAALDAPLNGMQRALHEAAAHLPPLGGAPSVLDAIENHIENLVKGFMPAIPNHATSRDATVFVKDRLQQFLSGRSTKP